MVLSGQGLLFVTVGTTRFDQLVKALDQPHVLRALQNLGVQRIRLQVGRGTYFPTQYLKPTILTSDDCHDGGEIPLTSLSPATVEDEAQQRRGDSAFIPCDIYRFRKNYSDDFKQASLIISHAGAGSIIEALSSKAKVLVVVNDKLMDNHQVELAEAMASRKYLAYTTCSAMESSLHPSTFDNLLAYPNPDYDAFPRIVDSEF